MQARALASLPLDVREMVAQRQLSLTEGVRIAHLARRLASEEAEADA
jgi:hypothetical protein